MHIKLFHTSIIYFTIPYSISEYVGISMGISTNLWTILSHLACHLSVPRRASAFFILGFRYVFHHHFSIPFTKMNSAFQKSVFQKLWWLKFVRNNRICFKMSTGQTKMFMLNNCFLSCLFNYNPCLFTKCAIFFTFYQLCIVVYNYCWVREFSI